MKARYWPCFSVNRGGCEVGTSTVYRVKQRFVEEGLERALSEAPRPGAERKLDATDEALLIAVTCSKPPAGRARWTLGQAEGQKANGERIVYQSATLMLMHGSEEASYRSYLSYVGTKRDGWVERARVEFHPNWLLVR